MSNCWCCFFLQEVSEPTKEEKAVAKYLRFNCPTKSTNMVGHRVDYFIGQCSASAMGGAGGSLCHQTSLENRSLIQSN